MFLIEHTRALRNVKRAVPLVIQIQVPAPLVLAPLALLAPQALVPNLTQILTCCHVLTQQSQSQKSLKKYLNLLLSMQQRESIKGTGKILQRFVQYLILKSCRVYLWIDFSREYFSRGKSGTEN